jgi:hypothetical protein
MMSNKHETALALIDEQIEKQEKSFYAAQANVEARKQALERAEKELKLEKWSLNELRASRAALQFDREANSVDPEPSEVP